MSIAALADTRLQRTEAENPSRTATEAKTKAGVPVGILNTLVQWIPTETLAGYVAVTAIMDPVMVPRRGLCKADFSDRWLVFAVFLGLTLVLVPAYTKIKADNSSTPFKWPFKEMGISGVAFGLWVFALSESPFDTICGVQSWHVILVVTVVGGLLAIATVMLKTSPAWSDAADNNAPPSPEVK